MTAGLPSFYQWTPPHPPNGGLTAGRACAGALQPIHLPDKRALVQGKLTFSASATQVVVAGDLNMAPSQLDVHAGADYSRMYSPDEKAVFQALLGSLTDTWRLQHPDATGQHTVWDEYTNARAFGRVRRRRGLSGHGG